MQTLGFVLDIAVAVHSKCATSTEALLDMLGKGKISHRKTHALPCTCMHSFAEADISDSSQIIAQKCQRQASESQAMGIVIVLVEAMGGARPNAA